jgi:hypothetical protein
MRAWIETHEQIAWLLAHRSIFISPGAFSLPGTLAPGGMGSSVFITFTNRPSGRTRTTVISPVTPIDQLSRMPRTSRRF